MASRVGLFVLAIACLVIPWLVAARDGSEPKTTDAVRLRRPIALVLVEEGKKLLVANRDSGSITIVNASTLKVVSETQLGGKLSDLTATAKQDLFLATAEEGNDLIALEFRDGKLTEKRRFNVGAGAVSVRVNDDGRTATVARLWARQVAIVDLVGNEIVALIDLPFAPRRQLHVPGSSKMIVADSFGAHLAVIDVRSRKLERVHTLASVHNIRGLALDRSGKDVLLTHQTLYASGHPNAGEIRSGNLIANELRKLPLSAILDPLADPLHNDRVHVLGDIDDGAGDPAAVAETPEGKVFIALAGVNEVAIGEPDRALWTRLPVGRRPTALAIDSARSRAFVANTFDDSISVVDLKAAKVVATVELGNQPKDLTPAERGEMLFFDARLSLDGWFSCHSCHSDGHSNGRLNDNLTDGSFGTPKRVLSLLGVKDTAPWAWDGKMADLEKQVRNSLKSTMQGPTPSAERVSDLLAFLETLTPPPPVMKARGTTPPDSVERGKRLFAEQKCSNCHKEPAFTSARTFDVGLRDEAGVSHFSPPSLRGVSQGGPYFHDNRARTLTDVFLRHRHQLSADVSEDDIRDLLSFLGSL